MAVSHQLSSLRRRSFPSREARAQADGERTAGGRLHTAQQNLPEKLAGMAALAPSNY